MKWKFFVNAFLLAVLTAGCDKTSIFPSELNKSTTENTTDEANAEGTAQTPDPTSTGSGQVPAQGQAAPTIASPAQSVAQKQVQGFVQQAEGQTAHNMDNPTGTVRQYLAYVPRGYNTEQEKKWPVVLFLHGMGEQGTDVNDIYWTYFAWKTMDKGYPYILITPQLLSGNNAWSAADLNKLLDEVLPKYNTDYSRVIITGYSMGAHGVFDLAEYNPQRFSAAVPISGWGNVNQSYKIKDVAIWAFHGDNDPVVNVIGSINMINSIKSAGGTKAHLTVYQGKGHDVHAITYDNQEVINWMLDQRK